MSSAEQNSPNEKRSQLEELADQGALKSPPKRPALVSPPKRPSGGASQEPTGVIKPPQAEVVKKSTTVPPPKAVEPVEAGFAEPIQEQSPGPETARCQPIAPPSEPMQYRAIGLVRGTYQPTEADQLNRGALTTDEGSVIDAVLLGRVTSLVKKHIDLGSSHLWVVYPRTRRNDDSREQDLHLQIVGVWEPETLGLPGEAPPAAEAEAESPEAAAPESESASIQQVESESPEAGASGTESLEAGASGTESLESETESAEANPATTVAQDVAVRPAGAEIPPVNDNFFSIRGEVVKYDPDEQLISVKILQGIRRSPGSSKPFKVNLQGTIEGRTVGYFWDFKAKREDQILILDDASMVGIVPPKKRSKKKSDWGKPSRSGGGRPMPSRRPTVVKGSLRPRKVDAGKDLGA
jgi:hypothetical protein